VLLANKRASHDCADGGAVNVNVADAVPSAGMVWALSKYFHAISTSSEASAGHDRPTQSVALPGPFATTTVSVPPAGTDAGVVNVGPEMDTMPLVPSRV